MLLFPIGIIRADSSFEAASPASSCRARALVPLRNPATDLAPAMIQSALGPSPLEENLRYLTDTIGGRVTGSPAADRAVGWAVEALHHAGVDEVHTEKFTVPVSWSEGNSHIEILSPEPFPVRMVSIGWSPATPEGGITGEYSRCGSRRRRRLRKSRHHRPAARSFSCIQASLSLRTTSSTNTTWTRKLSTAP